MSITDKYNHEECLATLANYFAYIAGKEQKCDAARSRLTYLDLPAVQSIFEHFWKRAGEGRGMIADEFKWMVEGFGLDCSQAQLKGKRVEVWFQRFWEKSKFKLCFVDFIETLWELLVFV